MYYLQASLRRHRIVGIDADTNVVFPESNENEQSRNAQLTTRIGSHAALKRSLPNLSLQVDLNYSLVVLNKPDEMDKRQDFDKIFDYRSGADAAQEYGTGTTAYEVMRGTSRTPADSSREL